MALIGGQWGPTTHMNFSTTALYRGGAIFVQMIDNHNLNSLCQEVVSYSISLHLYSHTYGTQISHLIETVQSLDKTLVHPCQMINNHSNLSSYYVKVTLDITFEWRGISFDDHFNMREHVGTDKAN